MKIKWKPLIMCVALPLAVGALAAFLSREGMEAFPALNQPPLSPPQWVFGVVWTILYILIGLAAYRVAISDAARRLKRLAFTAYGMQLAANFLWNILFFVLGQYLTAFFWLIALWLLILATMLLFARADRGVSRLMIPYALWTAFAGYLNWGIYCLNQ